MQQMEQYLMLLRPEWAPPAWLFSPVWTILYALTAISFGYVAYKCILKQIPFRVVLPFILNLIFNFAFAPLQFRLQNFWLATADIVLVLITLVWAIVAIFPFARWVSFINIPYLLWVAFATVLQVTLLVLNFT